MKNLKFATLLPLLATLLIVLSTIAGAQDSKPADPPKRSVILTTEYQIKAGMLSDYLNYIKNETRPIYLSAGAKRTEVLTTVFGNNGIVYVMEYFENFADMTKSRAEFSQKGGAALQAVYAKGTQYLASPPRQLILRGRPDLSWINPKANYTAPTKYYLVTRRWIAPTRVRDYVNYLQNEYLPLLKKSDEIGAITTYLQYGDELQYYVTTPLRELADLDKPSTITNVISPDDLSRLQQLRLTGVVSKTDFIVLRFRDDLSISTKQSQEAAKK